MSNGFIPAVWPECAVPADVEGCTGCELHKQRKRIVWGEGNPDAHILVLLDNPGLREDKEGQAFVCGTRQTLQYAAYETGFKAEDLYISYVVKCRPVRKYDKETARSTCLGYLDQQIKLGYFMYVLCLGDVAVQAFFGDAGRNVKNTRGLWHDVRGLPTRTSYHPLAVRRRPNLYGSFINDWEALAKKYHQLK